MERQINSRSRGVKETAKIQAGGTYSLQYSSVLSMEALIMVTVRR